VNADQGQGNWLQHHKDFAAHRFASLVEITKDTAKSLHVAWKVSYQLPQSLTLM